MDIRVVVLTVLTVLKCLLIFVGADAILEPRAVGPITIEI